MFNAICLAVGIAASAIQWGWQPLPEGGHAYIVQVEPQLTDLATFRKEGFTSEIPPGLRDIREIHIVVGSNPLPHQGEIPEAPAKLPGGVTANPLHSAPPAAAPAVSVTPPVGDTKSAAPAVPKSEKVTLTDSHESAESTPPANKKANRPIPDTSTRNANPHETAAATSDKLPPARHETPVATTQAEPAPVSKRPWMALVLVAAGLIVSLSGNVFLGWVHWGTRNQYRAVVSQLRKQRTIAATS
jgi:hypothetical protein